MFTCLRNGARQWVEIGKSFLALSGRAGRKEARQYWSSYIVYIWIKTHRLSSRYQSISQLWTTFLSIIAVIHVCSSEQSWLNIDCIYLLRLISCPSRISKELTTITTSRWDRTGVARAVHRWMRISHVQERISCLSHRKWFRPHYARSSVCKGIQWGNWYVSYLGRCWFCNGRVSRVVGFELLNTKWIDFSVEINYIWIAKSASSFNHSRQTPPYFADISVPGKDPFALDQQHWRTSGAFVIFLVGQKEGKKRKDIFW